MKKIAAAAFVLFALCGCKSSSEGSLSTLLKDVDSYHRDLVFARYDIAARRIVPESRAAWMDGIKSQGIRFAEIDVIGTDYCTSSDKNCVIVQSQVQWYAGGSPSVQESQLTTTWRYDSEEKVWKITEQQ